MSHQDTGGSWLGCWSLSQGPQLLTGLGPGLVEVEMLGPAAKDPGGQLARQAGPEDSPLLPGSTCPILFYYPKVESHVPGEDASTHPWSAALLPNPHSSYRSGTYLLHRTSYT